MKKRISAMVIALFMLMSMAACNNETSCNCDCDCSDCTCKKDKTSSSESSEPDDSGETSEETSEDSEVVYDVTDAVKASKAYKFLSGIIVDDAKLRIESSTVLYEYYIADGEMCQYVKSKGETGSEAEDFLFTKGKNAYSVDMKEKQYYVSELSQEEIDSKANYMQQVLKSMFLYIDYIGEDKGYEKFKFKGSDTSELTDDIELSVDSSVKSTATGTDVSTDELSSNTDVVVASGTTDSDEETSGETSVVEDTSYLDYLYMKVDDNKMVIEQRKYSGEIVTSSTYTIVKITDEDKKRMDITGYKEVKFEESTDLPSVPEGSSVDVSSGETSSVKNGDVSNKETSNS